MTKKLNKKFVQFCRINEIVLPSKTGDYICQFVNEIENELQEENEQLKEQVNTYLEMLASETKKRIPDSKGYTVWEKSLTEKLKEAKEIIRKLITLVDFFNEDNVKEPLVAKAEAFLKG